MKPFPKTLTILTALLLLTILPAPERAGAAQPPWLEEDFENGVNGVFDTTFGLKPTSSGHQGDGLYTDIFKGDHWGGSAHWYTKTNIGSEPQEMWMRYWLRFPTGFKVNPPYRGKLPGFGGLYTYNCLGNRPSTAAAPCWSARMAFQPVYASDGLPSYPYNPAQVTRISFYSYLLNSGGTGQDGRILNWNPDLSTLQHGRWYCIEARVKVNSLGQSNGILEGYVDGDRAYAASNLTFRRPSESQLKVKSLWFDIYYGGDGTSPINNKIFFDSLAAGPERIGCNDRPQASGRFFDDDDSVFEAAIERLAASGITEGCNPPVNDRFCPDDSVTRGQMAAFLKRALGDQYQVTIPPEPPSPPDFWGGRSHLAYKTALSVYEAGGAGFDTFGVSYWVDDTSGEKDWLATGTSGNPNIWVPTMLGHIWDAGATPYIRIIAKDLDGLASGKHDKRLNNMLAAFAKFTDLGGGRRVILDILPEPNLRSNPWGDDRAGVQDRVPQNRGQGKHGHRLLSCPHRIHCPSLDVEQPIFGCAMGHRRVPPLLAGCELRRHRRCRRVPTSGGTNVGYHEAAVNEMSNAAGPGVPIIIAAGGAPNRPSEAAQTQYAGALAQLAARHPQVVGVQWDDWVKGGLDLRVSSASGLQSGFATAAHSAQDGGVDWLFSSNVASWASARNAANPFDDSTSSIFSESIKWLNATGITEGCGPRRFCPDARVTRGQMAAFLVRALHLPAPARPKAFVDTRGHLFEGAIARLAHAGITVGCNPPSNNRFCPNSDVTRGEMAAFLVRAGLTD